MTGHTLTASLAEHAVQSGGPVVPEWGPVPVHASPVVPTLAADEAVRFGLIALSTDLVLERDAARLLPATAALHVTRVGHTNPTTPDTLRRMAPHLAGAAALLVPGAPLAAIAYGCTSATVTIGDGLVVQAIGQGRPGVPVVTPPDAAVAGFRALGVRRIALVAPYLAETTAPMAAYFAAAGLEVVTAHCLGLADDRDIARLTPDTLCRAAEAADGPPVQGLFLSCTNLPALDLVPGLEARLGKPVVTSNLALIWRLLGAGGIAPAAGCPPCRLWGADPPRM